MRWANTVELAELSFSFVGQIKDTLQNGTALDRFEKMLVCQNVDEAVARELCRGDVRKVLPRAQSVTPLLTAVSGMACLPTKLLC